MKYMIYSSKFEAILNAVAVSGRGMLSRFYFVLIRDRSFRFLVGEGAVFFQQLQLDFLDKVKAFIFL